MVCKILRAHLMVFSEAFFDFCKLHCKVVSTVQLMSLLEQKLLVKGKCQNPANLSCV